MSCTRRYGRDGAAAASPQRRRPPRSGPRDRREPRMTGIRYLILELRQYTLRPGRRDDLIALFETELIAPQEAAGMALVGQFRDVDDPDRFVWLRGFPDMRARAEALGRFYQGPAWRRHRDEANATMIDSDDVLLLRPAARGPAFPPRPPPGRPSATAARRPRWSPRRSATATGHSTRRSPISSPARSLRRCAGREPLRWRSCRASRPRTPTRRCPFVPVKTSSCGSPGSTARMTSTPTIGPWTAAATGRPGSAPPCWPRSPASLSTSRWHPRPALCCAETPGRQVSRSRAAGCCQGRLSGTTRAAADRERSAS